MSNVEQQVANVNNLVRQETTSKPAILELYKKVPELFICAQYVYDKYCDNYANSEKVKSVEVDSDMTKLDKEFKDTKQIVGTYYVTKPNHPISYWNEQENNLFFTLKYRLKRLHEAQINDYFDDTENTL